MQSEAQVSSAPDAVGRAQIQRRVYVEAFGCQMNFLDGELAVSRLSGHGWTRTSDPEDADLILFNTCSIRDQSENRVWSRLGALRPRKERDPGLPRGAQVVRAAAAYDHAVVSAGLSPIDALEVLHRGAAYDHDPEIVAGLRRVLQRRGVAGV